MADAYIDEAYVKAALGDDYVDAALGVTGISLTQLIETATGRVQAAIRKNGYATPATTTDQTVREATLGAVIELLSNIPEAKVDLKEHPALKTYGDILSEDGTLQITHEFISIAAAGGAKFSESDPLVTGSRPQRASRKNLVGY